MIPKLFPATETLFSGEGLGRLTDCTKCEVTEERNGMYELVLQYPVSGRMFNELQLGRYISAWHDDGRAPEEFQIYRLERPLEGFITVRAWHISYALNFITVEPFSAFNISGALTGITSHSMNTNPFTFWTDKTSLGAFILDKPATVRSILGGMQGSILDVFGGGEYEFTGTLVKLYASRGANNGVSIRYGKNLVKLDQELDASNVCNSVVPYWTNGEDTVASPNIITRTGETADRVIPLDLSSYFTEAPAVEDLDLWAQDIIDNSSTYTLKENLKIDFVALWQTEEYKDVANLQRVKLCDTVNIYYAKMGVNVTAKVIKVVYDSLRERYTSIELGEPQTTLAQQIQESIVQPAVADKPSTTMMSEAINHATELISGGFGGYIKYNYLSDGTPSEMLIMDSPSEATATNIIRLNQNGLGFSTDGGATYANAWTIDGQLVADFITTGTLNANVIRAGIIQDTNADNYWDLGTGEFVTKKGEIANYIIETNKLTNGTIVVGGTGSQLSPTNLILVAYTLIDSTGGVQTFGTRYTKLDANGLTFQQAIAGVDSAFKSAGYINPKYDVANSDYTLEMGFGSSRRVITLRDPNDIGSVGYAFYVWDRAGFYKLVYFQNGLQAGGDIKITSAGVQKFLADTSGNVTMSGDLIATGTPTVVSSGIVDSVSILTLKTEYGVKFGKIAMVTLDFTGSLSSGGSATGTIASGWRPPANMFASGVYYFGARAIVISIDSSGNFTVRNAGSSTANGTSSSPIRVTATYILG